MPNPINIDNHNDLKIQAFLGHCILYYKGTKFEFSPVPKLKDGACEYIGEAFEGWLRIATGGDQKTWLEVFLHETCHLDQAQENQEWFNSIDPHIADLDNWLDNKETKLPVSWETVSKIVELEHDCEKRAIEKIKTFSLPINIDNYSQKANAYLKSYIQTLNDKKWDSTPYTNPDKWRSMPKTLMTMQELDEIAQKTLSNEKTLTNDKALPIETEIN